MRPLIAVLTVAALSLPASGTVAAQATASASATVLQQVSVSVAQTFSAGATKTNGSNPTGTVVVPATYPLFATPAPTFTNATPQNGAKAQAPNAARIDITGAPGASFILTLQGWSQLSGAAGAAMSVASSTFYSPSNAPTNQARGVLDQTGHGTVYVGGTIVLARDPNGSTVTMKPIFTVAYN